MAGVSISGTVGADEVSQKIYFKDNIPCKFDNIKRKKLLSLYKHCHYYHFQAQFFQYLKASLNFVKLVFPVSSCLMVSKTLINRTKITQETTFQHYHKPCFINFFLYNSYFYQEDKHCIPCASSLVFSTMCCLFRVYKRVPNYCISPVLLLVFISATRNARA